MDLEMINFYLTAADVAPQNTVKPQTETVAVAAPVSAATLSQEDSIKLKGLVQGVLNAKTSQQTASAFQNLTGYINSGASDTQSALTHAIQDMNSFNSLVQKLTLLEKSGNVNLTDIEGFVKSILPPEQAAALQQVVNTVHSAQTLFSLVKILWGQAEPIVDPVIQKVESSCSCLGGSKAP